MEADLHKRLMERAGAILRRRAHSRGELSLKLSGFAASDDVEKALDRLQELDLLNDARYAYNFALHLLTETGWGPRKVSEALHLRKLSVALIESVLEKIGREIGYEAMLTNYLERHCLKSGFPSNRKGLHRLVQHLQRRGFAEEHIYSVLRRKVPAEAWHDFENGE
jgi:SOS response regulatory protein OraA/RecX